MDVKEVVKHIRRLPEAFVDCGFRQGRDAVLAQLGERSGKNEDAFVDADMQDMQDTIDTLIQKAAPCDIPDDYIVFLEFYGGLAIGSDDLGYRFSVFGVGPMVEEWYSSVVSDEALQEPGKYGFLSLGSLNFREGKHRFQRVSFFLDLTGNVQRNCVIGVGPWGQDTLKPLTVIKDIHAYPGMWRKIASLFAEWLEQAAETRGAFGYA